MNLNKTLFRNNNLKFPHIKKKIQKEVKFKRYISKEKIIYVRVTAVQVKPTVVLFNQDILEGPAACEILYLKGNVRIFKNLNNTSI